MAQIVRAHGEIKAASGVSYVMDDEIIKHNGEKLKDVINNAASVVNDKADKTYVDEQLEAKANSTTVSALDTRVSANATNIANLSNYATPEMYGAVGDGVTDDSDAIRNAISNNNVIVFKQGATYLINKVLKIEKSNISIIGNNAKIKVAIPYNGVLFYIHNSSNGIENISIDGLIIDGQYSKGRVLTSEQSLTYDGSLIYIEHGNASDKYVKNVNVSNCILYDNVSTCIIINGASGNDSTGYSVVAPVSANVNNCKIYDAFMGVVASGAEVVISNNKIYNMENENICVDDCCYNCFITTNRLGHHAKEGSIGIDYCDNLVIDGNIIEDTRYLESASNCSGIQFNANAGESKNVTITNNIIKGNRNCAIWFRVTQRGIGDYAGAKNVTIEGNIFKDNQYADIEIDNLHGGLLKIGSNFFGNTAEPVRFNPESDESIVDLIDDGKSFEAINYIKFPYISGNKTSNGVTFTQLSDGGLRISGVASQETWYDLCDIQNTNICKKTMVVHGTPKKCELNVTYLKNGDVVSGVPATNNNIINVHPQDADRVIFNIRVPKGTSVNETIYPMAENCIIPHKYIKYSGSGNNISENVLNVYNSSLKHSASITVTSNSEGLFSLELPNESKIINILCEDRIVELFASLNGFLYAKTKSLSGTYDEAGTTKTFKILYFD